MSTEEMRKKIVSWFQDMKMDAMDFLQGEMGLVSDNAMSFEEVADADIRLCYYLIFTGEMEKSVKNLKL